MIDSPIRNLKIKYKKYIFYSKKINLGLLFMTLAYPVFSFQNPLDLYDFSGSKTSGSWKIVNDGVVGGVSES